MSRLGPVQSVPDASVREEERRERERESLSVGGGQSAAAIPAATEELLPGGQSFRCAGVPTACAAYISEGGDAREDAADYK